MFGCQFEAPISAAVLSAAQLRRTIDIGEASPPTLVCILGQANMAERLGVSGPSISGWEKSRARPKEDRLADLANLLGVPVSQLLVDPQPDMIHDLIDASRERIARATGVAPERVRIIVEF